MTPGTVVNSDPITLDIERSDKPVKIRVEEDSLVFDKPEQSQSLLVWGTCADGAILNITRSS